MTAKPKLFAVPSDAEDFESLWQDPALGDGIVNVGYHTVPVGKPKDFFRTHPDSSYRRRAEIYIHKPEGIIDEQCFIIAPSMQGRIPEAQPCAIVTVVYRDGSPRLWPVKFPKDGERDNDAWVSARTAARIAIDRWIKVVWVRRTYQTREAQDGYAPDPDFSRLPPFNELVKLALGEHGIIRDTAHPIYRELFGIPKEAAPANGDL
jgi:hypothetical protein